jgi:vitamin B12 transporter
MKKTAITLSFCAAMSLSAQTNQATIAPITITSATKSEQSIQDVTSNVEIITGAELEEKKITTVLDALRVKGISVTQNGAIGQASSLFLRGFSASNTLVLIDGVRYNEPTSTEGQAQLEHLTVSDIERIEIIKGAQSGIWGADAVAGVINIITKKPNRKLQINANVAHGSNGSQTYKMSISQKMDKLSYFIGANFFKTDGISAITPYNENPKNYEKDGYENTTLNAKAAYDLTDWDTIDFSITDIYAKVEYDNHPAWGASLENKANNADYELKQKNRIYKTSYRHDFDTAYVELSYQRTDFKKDDPLGFVPKYRGKSDRYDVKSKVEYLESSFFIVGAEKSKFKDKENDTEVNNEGYYATNSNRFDNFVVTQSIRHDTFDKFKNKTTGKLGIKYLFNDDIDLSINYGSAYKAPSLDQLYNPFYGNDTLMPESTKGYDVTFGFHGFSLTYYENKTKDLIEYDMNTWAYSQVEGTSKFKGYEARYQNEVYEDLLLGLSYNKIYAKNSQGQYLQRRARVTAGASVDYYGFSKTHLGVYANYTGTRYDDIDQTIQTGRYTLVDAIINYDITKNFSTYFKVENLADKRYQEVYGYGTPGRTFRVGLNAKF